MARYAHSIGTNNLDHVKISLTYLIAFHESDEEDAYRAFDKEMERLTHSLQAILIGVDACIDKGDARLRTIKNQADQLLELLEELEE